MKLSLSMIVRNNAETIGRCLESILGAVDEAVIVDTGATDGTPDIIREKCEAAGVPLNLLKWEDPLGHEKWISDFSAARNFGLDACTGDMVIWLDSDDVFVERVDGELHETATTLRPILEKNSESSLPDARRIDAWNVLYDYAQDGAGRSTKLQRRRRIFRRGDFKWGDGTMPVHEDIVPLCPVQMNMEREAHDLPFWVSHMGGGGRSDSAERNIWITDQYEKAGGKMTPRLYCGRGQAYHVLSDWRKSAEEYTKALDTMSPDALVNDEAYDAYLRRADCYRHMKDYALAMDDLQRAERAQPTRSTAYLAMAETLGEQGLWDEARIWVDRAEAADGDEKAESSTPMTKQSVIALVRARAFQAKNMHGDALPYYEQLAKWYPEDAEFQHEIKRIKEALAEVSLMRSAVHVYQSIPAEARTGFVASLPKNVHHYFAQHTRPARPIDRPTVVIYCGDTVNPWGPSSISTGTGGSEESAIYLSRYLVKKGYHVEIYNTTIPRDVGVDEHGVVWQPAYSFEVDHPADIFVSWRNQNAIRLADGFEQKWLWIQDNPVPEFYPKRFCDKLDGILAISDYQISRLGPHGKAIAVHSANGIEPSAMVDGPNHSNCFIYASSPDRGQLQLLRAWPKIREAVPGAELHLFYGFRDVYTQAGRDRATRISIKAAIEAELDQEGVINHGMVGQHELHKWFAECGFWLYPTSFEETYCITAAKAQAMGAIPITSRYKVSCLDEVCGEYDLGPEPGEGKFDEDPLWQQRWLDAVLAAQGMDLDMHRENMKAHARAHMTWQSVADQWDELFKSRAEALRGEVVA